LFLATLTARRRYKARKEALCIQTIGHRVRKSPSGATPIGKYFVCSAYSKWMVTYFTDKNRKKINSAGFTF
jgi:hypothetical protein